MDGLRYHPHSYMLIHFLPLFFMDTCNQGYIGSPRLSVRSKLGNRVGYTRRKLFETGVPGVSIGVRVQNAKHFLSALTAELG